MKSDEQLDRIKKLIADQQGYPINRITMNTRLQADTGMEGDQGEVFLKRYQDELDVDMDTLRYNEHFVPRGLSISDGFLFAGTLALIAGSFVIAPWLVPLWVLSLFLYFHHVSYRKHLKHLGEIRVSDLLHSAETHHWDYHYQAA